MFTGIIESVGVLKDVISNGSNKSFWVESAISNLLNPDQSVSHNGVCLTVEAVTENRHKVTAIKETSDKTNIGTWKTGENINLERAMKLGDRLDGHIVQGHIDQTAICTKAIATGGSWFYTFEYDSNLNNITIEKGSITVNGVSLTVVNSEKNSFSVAIIPYTYENTTFKTFKIGTKVNLEFDVIGKYITKLNLLRS